MRDNRASSPCGHPGIIADAEVPGRRSSGRLASSSGGLYRITSESRGFTGLAIQLGPFGGSQAAGPNLQLWVASYLAIVVAATLAAFARKEL